MEEDIFTQQYRKDYIGTSSGDSEPGGEYSTYRDPVTGKQKYYQGQLPLKKGLPADIEEGSPEAMEYIADQIEIYGLGGNAIDDSTIKAKQKEREGSQITDPTWIRASKMLYDYMNAGDPDAKGYDTPGEYAEWGVDFILSFENNFTNMVFDIAAMENAPAQAWHAFYYLLETSDREGIKLDNLMKGAYYTVFDWANVPGLLTMGWGLAGKAAGKQLTKVGFKEAVKRIVMSKPDASDFFMMGEGAILTGGMDAGSQTVKMEAGKQDGYDVTQGAISTATGTVAGPLINRGGQAIGEGIKRGAGKVADILSPSAETIASKNIDDIIDESQGVDLEVTPNADGESVDVNVKPTVNNDLKRVGTTGQYVGAPKGLDSPQKLAALRRNMLNIAKQGEPGRFWYERSSQAILDAVNGDKEAADKIAQAIAITSGGQTPVMANFEFAIQAYNNWQMGKEIVTGRFPTVMGPKLQKVFDGGTWDGRKTNTFYNNVMVNIDPKRAQGVTVDMHMMRVFGFDTDNPSPQQYEFVENEVNRISEKLGWTNYQTQAAMWVVQKANKEGKSVADMSFDYKDALEKTLGQISWETKPSATSGHFNEIFNAPIEQQAEFHHAMSKALTGDDGVDLLAKEFGLLSPGSFDAPGVFEGVISPGSQTYALMPKKYKGNPGEVDEATLDLVKQYMIARGILLKQDGVGAHRLFYNKGVPLRDKNAVSIDIGRPMTNEEVKQLDKLLTDEFGSSDFAPVSTEDGVNIVNFMEMGPTYKTKDGTEKVDNTEFQNKVKKVLNIFQISDIQNKEGMVVELSASQNIYVSNVDYGTGKGWKEYPNGEFYLEEASQDSKIYKRGFVLSSRNMQTASEQSKMNSQPSTAGQEEPTTKSMKDEEPTKVSSVPSNTEEGGL